MSIFFISYQRDSHEFAKELKRRMEDREMLGWLAPEDISAGEDWKPAIDSALRSCMAAIVVVTPKSLSSQYVTYEWSFALGLEKKVIPLIREFPKRGQLKMHPRLDDKQFRNFIAPEETTWEQLLDELWDLWKPEEIPPEIKNAEDELYRSNPNARQTAIEFLLKHENKVIVAKVFGRAVRSGSPDISAENGIALARLTDNQDKNAVPGLLRAVGVNKVRNEAIERLALTNTEEAIQALVECLAKYGELALLIMQAMAKVKNPAVVPELVKLLSSTYAPIIPVEVINALGEHRDPSTVQALGRFLSITQSQELKIPAVNALVKINRENAIKPLYEVFKRQVNKDENLCNHILGAIRDIGGEVALEVLADARVQNDPNFQRYSITIDKCIDQVRQKLREA